MKKVIILLIINVILSGSIAASMDKTLVAWVMLDSSGLGNPAGSVLTIQRGDDVGAFDGIVFGEVGESKWMAGSEFYNRTQMEQDYPAETATDELIQIAIVYEEDEIRIYRNGELLTSHNADNINFLSDENQLVVFGLRHFGGTGYIRGEVEDARIYAEALTSAEIQDLEPNQASEIEPWAWWDFEDKNTQDRMGRFSYVMIRRAEIANGRLELDSSAVMVTTRKEETMMWAKEFLVFNEEDMEVARKVRRLQLADPIRPVWHFTIAEGKALAPFDPNGAFFRDGIYHICHIYKAGDNRWRWQHVSSKDLFHWRWHLHDLQAEKGDPEDGISSGNAFIDKDGNVVFVYHGACTNGTCVAKSYDDDCSGFRKSAANPIAITSWADPHMWLENGTYFLLSGSEQNVKGAAPQLFIGDQYDQPMKLMGDFMTSDMPDVDDFEDVSCPDFFKLEDKWVLICISHPRGARYYIGEWDGQQFKPESHHRMNWPGGSYFAPETVLDDQGRRILWAWLIDRKEGYSTGMFAMPRVLELADDKLSLKFAPPKEIERLRYNPKQEEPFTVEAGRSITLDRVKGNIIELDLTIAPQESRHFGIRVFCSEDGREQTAIVIDREMNTIKIDMSQSSLDNPKYYEFVMPWSYVLNGEPNPETRTMTAPFKVEKGENVRLKVFLDKSVLEVFANGRQCLTQVIYPTLEDAEHVQIFADDAPIEVLKLQAWDLFPAMQW